MNHKFPKYIFLLGVAFVLSCSTFSYEEHVVDEYYLIAGHVMEQMSLSHKVDDGFIEIVRPAVFAAGHDERYIIVKQHPLYIPKLQDPPGPRDDMPQREITNYYIVPRHQPKPPFWEIVGPLDSSQFARKQIELSVRARFTTVIKSLE